MATVIMRDATIADSPLLVSIGIATGLFSESEADELLGEPLRELADGTRDRTTAAARVAIGTDGSPSGWTFLAAEDAGSWELFWIGVSRAAEGTGVGAVLLKDAEGIAGAAGARALKICTSATPATARARAFYERHGYTRVGEPAVDFYGPGDDKIEYMRAL
jgi:GNAT superfamily N-acetyltransferase